MASVAAKGVAPIVAQGTIVAKGAIEVEAELKPNNALIQLVHYSFTEPPDSTLQANDCFRIDLSLSSRHRSSRACFSDVWSQHRFERIGDIFLAPPGMKIRARSDEDEPISSVVCQLNPQFVLSLFDELPDLTDQHLLASLDIQDSRVRGLLLRLAEEARRPGFASEMLVESIVVQLAVELFRLGTGVLDQLGHGGLAPWQLRHIDECLKDVRETPTLSELAEICRISVRQLTRGFRASRGCPIGAYVANSQMEHAKRLLAANESVATIATKLGFSTSSNFCFAFRRSMGLTPGQYRKLMGSSK